MLHAVYNTSQTQQLLWLLISVSLRTAHTDCILHLGINPVWYNALHTSSITPCLVFALYSAQHSIAIPVGTYFLDITQLHITSGSHPTSHPPANTSGSHNNNTQVHTTSLEPLWSSNTVHNVVDHLRHTREGNNTDTRVIPPSTLNSSTIDVALSVSLSSLGATWTVDELWFWNSSTQGWTYSREGPS